MTDLQTNDRVRSDEYAVAGEILWIELHPEHGKIAKVRHDDGFENYYRIDGLSPANDGKKIHFIRGRAN